MVVNCFCSLKLWYLQQQVWRGANNVGCCELLLFLEIMIFATAAALIQQATPPLWIAFVPWNYDICNSGADDIAKCVRVVNCFCSLKLWYLQQRLFWYPVFIFRCELLLFLEIMIFATALYKVVHIADSLWIAFVPWNYDICNSQWWACIYFAPVVNCFCSLKLWYLQQQLFQLYRIGTVVNCFCSLILWYLQQLS